jgi:hypothetical protein
MHSVHKIRGCSLRVQKRYFISSLFSSASSNAPKEPKFTESRLIPFSPTQIYDVVIDVDKYHQFLPWCLASDVIKSTIVQNANGHEKFNAELTIGAFLLAYY